MQAFNNLAVINDIPFEMLNDPYQREIYKAKLRQEIANFKQHETMYTAKRRELL